MGGLGGLGRLGWLGLRGLGWGRLGGEPVGQADHHEGTVRQATGDEQSVGVMSIGVDGALRFGGEVGFDYDPLPYLHKSKRPCDFDSPLRGEGPVRCEPFLIGRDFVVQFLRGEPFVVPHGWVVV